MDASKIFTILCAFLLVICLVLSITALIVMRNAVSESQTWHDRAAVLVSNLNTLLENVDESDDSVSTSTDSDTNEPSTDVDVLYNRFTMRETEGKIGVYTEEGYLIRLIDVNVKTLPKEEQDRLLDGISVNSWRELIELMQDYEE